MCRLPRGADPADLARTDPGALAKSVVDAVPFLQFRLDAALAGADVSTPEGRARAAERALAVIVEHPSDLVRDQYVMQVADRCRLDPTLLRDDVARQLRTGRRATAAAAPTQRRSAAGRRGPRRPRGAPPRAARTGVHAAAAVDRPFRRRGPATRLRGDRVGGTPRRGDRRRAGRRRGRRRRAAPAPARRGAPAGPERHRPGDLGRRPARPPRHAPRPHRARDRSAVR